MCAESLGSPWKDKVQSPESAPVKQGTCYDIFHFLSSPVSFLRSRSPVSILFPILFFTPFLPFSILFLFSHIFPSSQPKKHQHSTSSPSPFITLVLHVSLSQCFLALMPCCFMPLMPLFSLFSGLSYLVTGRHRALWMFLLAVPGQDSPSVPY